MQAGSLLTAAQPLEGVPPGQGHAPAGSGGQPHRLPAEASVVGAIRPELPAPPIRGQEPVTRCLSPRVRDAEVKPRQGEAVTRGQPLGRVGSKAPLSVTRAPSGIISSSWTNSSKPRRPVAASWTALGGHGLRAGPCADFPGLYGGRHHHRPSAHRRGHHPATWQARRLQRRGVTWGWGGDVASIEASASSGGPPHGGLGVKNGSHLAAPPLLRGSPLPCSLPPKKGDT